MKYQKLISKRKANFTQIEMALKVAMDQTTYSRKERGLSLIKEDEWIRFAKALDVKVEEIKEEHKTSNSEFYENAANIQLINIPKDVYEILIKYNHMLEEENQNLKNNF